MVIVKPLNQFKLDHMKEKVELEGIIRHVREIFFRNHNITSFGKFHWTPISEKQSIRYLNKTGREWRGQKWRFITEYFFDQYLEVNKDPNVKNQSLISQYYHLLISNIDTRDFTFYIIADNSVGPKVGEITRFKFQMDDIENLKSIRLISKKIIAIR